MAGDRIWSRACVTLGFLMPDNSIVPELATIGAVLLLVAFRRYPRAPEPRRGSGLTPAEEFWVVKHGIKMTGMPAWGVTHDDELLWDVVAFLRKIPELAAEQYQALVRSAPTHDEMMQKMDMDNSHEIGHQHHQ
jgi:Cytochrome C oxidase, cbb3-type, subunit III